MLEINWKSDQQMYKLSPVLGHKSLIIMRLIHVNQLHLYEIWDTYYINNYLIV
jgi:hypothetical protein